MEPLYTTEVSNHHLALVLKRREDWQRLEGKLNHQRLASDWAPLDFCFKATGKTAVLTPSICSVYFPGVLAFRSELRDVIFPSPCGELEFLPIRADDESWFLLNCLKSTSQYDPQQSVMMRSANGGVFFIQRVVVNDNSVRACGVFTIEDSNRGQLLVLPSVKERITKARAHGLNFPEIGVLK